MITDMTTGYMLSLSLCLSWVAVCCAVGESSAAEREVWIGTSTPRNGLSKGIYYTQLDTATGRLAEPQLAAEVENPGFLTLHPEKPILYSVGGVDGEPSVVAYRIERGVRPPQLKMINSQPIGDGGAAHLSTDRTGRVLLTAQYGGGSTAIFPLADDGSIEPRSQLVKHEGGTGVVEGRQDAPHAHWVGTSPDNRFVFVPDLGLDKVVIYELDVENARLTPHGYGQLPAGAGPRHMKFSNDGKYVYVLNELALSVTVFDYDAAKGTMTPVQTIATVSEQEKAKTNAPSSSEIRVHPSGNFVYAGNRGHDTISVFQVDGSNGKLTHVENEPVRGAWPRNFNVDPTGRWLVSAGQDSHNLTVFSVDPNSGELTYSRNIVPAPSPICVLFGAET